MRFIDYVLLLNFDWCYKVLTYALPLLFDDLFLCSFITTILGSVISTPYESLIILVSLSSDAVLTLLSYCGFRCNY